MAQDELTARIARARDEGWTRLDLHGPRYLPAEIGNLTSLTSLRLTHNQLTALPPEIGNLTNLYNLDLHPNKLTTLPSEMQKLVDPPRAMYIDGVPYFGF
jgi:Leucine-rich repeat (LRR) protein